MSYNSTFNFDARVIFGMTEADALRVWFATAQA